MTARTALVTAGMYDQRAATDIKAESGNPAVDVFVADLSSQAEGRRMAGEVLTAYPRLDVLVSNVGGFWAHRHVTPNGLEHTFALNHLAPFLLTSLLVERLIASVSARVVTVASGAQSMGKIDFGDLIGEQDHSGQRTYNSRSWPAPLNDLVRAIDSSPRPLAGPTICDVTLHGRPTAFHSLTCARLTAS